MGQRCPKPSKGGTMKKYTTRVVAILKDVLADQTMLEAKGVEMGDILAYTAKTTIPNILRHDAEMMIRELECECTHPDGMYSGFFAPETCCPDNLITFLEGSKTSIDCNNTCVHHLKHGE
jgi:hypothetical protein